MRQSSLLPVMVCFVLFFTSIEGNAHSFSGLLVDSVNIAGQGTVANVTQGSDFSVSFNYQCWSDVCPGCIMWIAIAVDTADLTNAQEAVSVGIPGTWPGSAATASVTLTAPNELARYTISVANCNVYTKQQALDQFETEFTPRWLNIGVINTTTGGLNENNVLPSTYELYQNFPNPFREQTTIKYQIPTESNVRITIYNATGQLVRTLIDGEKKAGEYTTVWDGRNNRGEKVLSGSYFYQIEAGDYRSPKKMILVK